MKSIEVNDLLITPEFPLAAAIQAFGFTLEYLDRTDPDRIQFCFLKQAGIDRIVEHWWKRTLMVNGPAYYESLKNLKARLRNEKKR